MPTTTLAEAKHEVRVEDVEYQRQGGKAMLARVYRPSGTGPYPAALQGAWRRSWCTKIASTMISWRRRWVESGILVASIGFPGCRPDGGYPASLQDIDLGIRWPGRRALGSMASFGPTGSAALARRAAGTRCCSRRCGPTTSATRRCHYPRRRRSTRGKAGSFPAGACLTRCCATISPRKPAIPS